jgi:hypothetical protein
VPTGAFKEMALRCFSEKATIKTFRTSGTSGQARGELHLDTLALYEASLLRTLRALLFPDLSGREESGLCIRVLAPSPAEAPDSSLSHMCGVLLESFGGPLSGYDVESGELQLQPLIDAVRAAEQQQREIALLGTAFSFVHLLEALAAGGVALRCPPGSRIMETGGFKGRSRERPREELYEELSARLGIPETRIVNQYGMTELGSQFYDSLLVDPSGPRRKLGPPWARVRLVDPESGRDVGAGQVGMIVIHDLANTGSIAAIQTADLGRRIEGSPEGFEILGREPGAEARGCSIAAAAMLSERA